MKIYPFIFAVMISATPAQAEPFDFKGIKLGTSLQEFKTLKHPDGKNAVPDCSAEGDNRIVTCTFGSIADGALSMGGGRYVSYFYSFDFAPDSSGVLRLYMINAQTNIDAVPDVLAALSGKFGKYRKTTGSVQNIIGNSFQSSTYTWSRPDSEIKLSAPYSKLDKMNLMFTYKPILLLLEASKASKRSAMPNKI